MNSSKASAVSIQSSIARTLLNIGIAYSKQEKYDASLKNLKEALEMFKRNQENKSQIAVALNAIGLVYEEQGKTEEALKFFNEYFDLIKQIPPSAKIALADTAFETGLEYYRNGNNEQALKSYNHALELFRQSEPLDNLSIADSLFKIGLVHHKEKRYEEALKCYRESLDIIKPITPINETALKDTMIYIGLIYEHKGNYEEAVKYYKELFDLLPVDSKFKAAVINQIRKVYCVNQNKSDEALTYLKQLLEIFKQTLPKNHPLIAAILNNIGRVHFDKKIFDEKTLSVNYFIFAQTLNKIGLVYELQGKHDDASKYIDGSLNITSQDSLFESIAKAANSAYSVGHFFRSVQNSKEALRLLNRSLELYKRISSSSLNIADVLNEIGLVYELMGELDKALVYFEQSDEMKRSLQSSDSRKLIKRISI